MQADSQRPHSGLCFLFPSQFFSKYMYEIQAAEAQWTNRVGIII